jgi:hypothetical protein
MTNACHNPERTLWEGRYNDDGRYDGDHDFPNAAVYMIDGEVFVRRKNGNVWSGVHPHSANAAPLLAMALAKVAKERADPSKAALDGQWNSIIDRCYDELDQAGIPKDLPLDVRVKMLADWHSALCERVAKDKA